jgi:hypothetical protein
MARLGTSIVQRFLWTVHLQGKEPAEKRVGQASSDSEQDKKNTSSKRGKTAKRKNVSERWAIQSEGRQ